MSVEVIPERGGGMTSLSEMKQSKLIVDDIPENIQLVGRITAMADVFDALTSKCPYKGAWPIESGVDFVKHESGPHFDPSLIPPFSIFFHKSCCYGSNAMTRSARLLKTSLSGEWPSPPKRSDYITKLIWKEYDN